VEEQNGKPKELSPGILKLIDALADDLVDDYLREEAVRRKALIGERSDSPPLDATRKTA